MSYGATVPGSQSTNFMEESNVESDPSQGSCDHVTKWWMHKNLINKIKLITIYKQSCNITYYRICGCVVNLPKLMQIKTIYYIES